MAPTASPRAGRLLSVPRKQNSTAQFYHGRCSGCWLPSEVDLTTGALCPPHLGKAVDHQRTSTMVITLGHNSSPSAPGAVQRAEREQELIGQGQQVRGRIGAGSTRNQHVCNSTGTCAVFGGGGSGKSGS